ncbi:MAG: SLC13 family permease [Candidatus Bathyarchaeia archaeon]
MKRQWCLYALLILCVVLLSLFSGLNIGQVYSVTVFSALILGTLFFWRFRLSFAFTSIAILLAAGLIDVPRLVEFAGFDIILFLAGMMVVIGFLEEHRFFEVLINKVIGVVGQDVSRLLVIIMVMAALFSALVGEVTSILFMTSTVLHLTGKYRVNPIPYVLMTVFATNIGSGATVVGNPVGVMIALRAGLTFTDFLRWASPIVIISLLAMIPLTMKYFSKDMKELEERMRKFRTLKDGSEKPTVRTSEFMGSSIFFAATILLLVFHHQLEELLHLERNTMLLGIALGLAGVALMIERDKAREIVETRVDWGTLSFFIILFASAGTLKVMGVTSILARSLLSFAGGSETTLFASLSLITGVLSAFMDNVLAVATFIPIIQDLQLMGAYSFPLWWGVLFAATFLGNLTIIGSTANIVALGMMERRKVGHITFLQWIKPGFAVSLPTIFIALILIFLQIPLMPR